MISNSFFSHSAYLLAGCFTGFPAIAFGEFVYASFFTWAMRTKGGVLVTSGRCCCGITLLYFALL